MPGACFKSPPIEEGVISLLKARRRRMQESKEDIKATTAAAICAADDIKRQRASLAPAKPAPLSSESILDRVSPQRLHGMRIKDSF